MNLIKIHYEIPKQKMLKIIHTREFFLKHNPDPLETGKMAQSVKRFSAKPEALSSILGTHRRERN